MTETALSGAPARAPAAPALWTTALIWIAFAAVLIALPQFFSSRTSLTLMNVMGIWIVFALSYNMLLGQTGMLSFGHAVYFGFGGFAAMHLVVAIKTYGLPIPVPAVPIVGFMVGWLAGAIIGSFSCKRAGTPFAMISLGVGELCAAAALMFVTIFGGEEGIAGDRTAGPELFGFSLARQINVYYFMAFWVFVAALAMWAFTKTPLGRLANAVRDNPDRVAFIGYDPQRIRYLVFMISGGFAGLAGSLSAINFEIITPDKLGAIPSGAVLLMAYIGGVVAFFGPIIGAVLIVLMQSMLSDYTKVWQLYLGLMFVVVVMFAPYGLGGIVGQILMAAKKGELAVKLPGWLLGLVGGIVAFVGAALLIEMTYRLREDGPDLRLLGFHFEETRLLSWLLATLIMFVGLVIVVIAVRWRRRGSLAAALVWKEASP